jgi:ABC-type glycerol-3-phosphate transport system substrate-binding protein
MLRKGTRVCPPSTTVTAVVAGLLVALTACSSGDADGTASSGPVKLEVWTTVTVPAQTDMIKKHLDACATQANAQVTVQTVTNDQISKRFSALGNQDPPNIISAIDTPIAFMYSRKGLVQVDDVIDKIGRDQFIEAPLHTVSGDGHTWAVPDAALNSSLWFRKGALAKAGVEPPQTWDELRAAAKALTTAGKGGEQYGISVPLGTSPFNVAADTTFQLFYSAGVTVFDPANGTYVFNKQKGEAVAALAVLADLYQNASPKASVQWGLSEYRNAFVAGQTAMVSDAGGVVGQAAQQNPAALADFDVVPFPGPQGAPKAHYGGAYHFAVGKGSAAKVKASKDTLLCMMKPSLVAERATTRPVFLTPALRSAYEESTYKDNKTIKQFSSQLKLIAEKIAPNPAYRYGLEGGLNPAAGQLETSRIIPDVAQKVALGQFTPEQGATYMDEQFQALLKR